MSGFAGIICTAGNTPDPGLLERMAGGLEFRGPDATQIWSRGSAGFCFTILRTGPAPQSSEQPCTLDGRVWLLGDVRLDGREDLRGQLEKSDEPISAEATDEELFFGPGGAGVRMALRTLTGTFPSHFGMNLPATSGACEI